MRAAGTDPGAAAAVAVAAWDEGLRRPVAVAAWGITGADADRWTARARDVVAAAAALEPTIVWVEIPGDAPAWAARARGRRRAGERDVRALSMRAGALAGLWRVLAPSATIVEVQQRRWAAIWGACILAGKQADGRHRVREAEGLMPGAAPILAALPRGVQVDAAEALLMAGAAILDARRKR